ncbi:hypothetical protein SAMN00777080_4092 [Aquiflexum balticum DSM 16537]|uniref:Amidohydrolase-related domain-containing protein n=1 Tax=Aquiflexum balticum DSM 16537 TaxID=758820 RepID=A0A1W2H993_9BACT|nr:amidohydrolase family protein [Aquiflexum balticum]SMD45441.1 hypothetical protein SAMN00777080_4092 [Aquiflexum balticum DSM 16537]
MSKGLKITGLIIMALAVIGVMGYFLFFYEKPIDQKALNEFLKGQPIIDVHIHVSKGFEGNEVYGKGLKSGPKLDQAKLDWFKNAFDQNNIVIGLSGGPVQHVLNWMKEDKRFWGGVSFPYNQLNETDEPFIKEFLTYEELFILYDSAGFRSMGESMYMYYGIHPHDERLDPYWKIAQEFNIPIGIHTEGPPPPWLRDEKTAHLTKKEYGNPELLRPILKKYPDLKLILFHFCGIYSDEAIQLMKDFPNVYCDISAVSYFMPKIFWEGAVKKLFKEGLGGRLLFGSDYMTTIRGHIEVIYSIDWLTEKEKRDIFYNNAAGFLELTTEEITQHYKSVEN